MGAAMEDSRRAQFVAAYTQILIAAWSSELFTRRLQDDPVDAIAEHGLLVPPGAKVTVVGEISPDHGSPNLDVAVQGWADGDLTGQYVLFVPSTPQMHARWLSDDDLAGVVAGYQVNQCCCTPCCCCS